MTRHFAGHVSTHELHTLQRSLLICQVFSFGSTHIAWLGHFFWHILQEMHLLTSITTCPRDKGVIFAVFTGYIRVAGFRKTLLATVPTISKIPIPVSPLRTPDTRVNRVDNYRYICQFATFQHRNKRGNIREGRCSDPGPGKVFGTVAFHVMDQFSPWLLNPCEKFTIRCASYFYFYRTIRDLLHCLSYQVN
jgi:hypothetical protein